MSLSHIRVSLFQPMQAASCIPVVFGALQVKPGVYSSELSGSSVILALFSPE
jgi:hypothetical protein